MIKHLKLLLGLMIFSNIQSSYAQVDSIRIIGFYRDNIEFSHSLQRSDFVDYVLGQKPHVDTTIIESNEIENLLRTMENLRIVDVLPFSANQVVKEGKLTRKGNHIRWRNGFDKSIDNRFLFVLFSDKQQEFVWSSGYYLDRGYYRYIIPERLKNVMKKYTYFFDD